MYLNESTSEEPHMTTIHVLHITTKTAANLNLRLKHKLSQIHFYLSTSVSHFAMPTVSNTFADFFHENNCHFISYV